MPFKIESLRLDRSIPTPLYYQLKTQIMDQVINNQVQIDEQIPNEVDLTEKLGISRSTVRQAINELVSEGYLHRVKAKGTFVSSPKVDEAFFQKLDSFNNEMYRKGLKPSTKVIECRVLNDVFQIKSKLQLAEDSKVILLDRLRYANDLPIVHVTTYLPYFKDLLEVDFESASLYEVLEEKHNLRVVRATREIEATISIPEDLKYMNVKPNSAICLVKSIAYSYDNLPVEYSVARYRGDSNKFSVELIRSK